MNDLYMKWNILFDGNIFKQVEIHFPKTLASLSLFHESNMEKAIRLSYSTTNLICTTRKPTILCFPWIISQIIFSRYTHSDTTYLSSTVLLLEVRQLNNCLHLRDSFINFVEKEKSILVIITWSSSQSQVLRFEFSFRVIQLNREDTVSRISHNLTEKTRI